LRNFVLRIVGTGDGDHLSGIDARAALRRRNIRGATPNDDLGFGIRIHQDAVLAFAQRTDGRIGRVNFRGGFCATVHRVCCKPLAELKQNL
jgi:hypothetical protein